MKENKGKEVMDEGVKSQPRPPTGEKRKNISSRVDLGDLTWIDFTLNASKRLICTLTGRFIH